MPERDLNTIPENLNPSPDEWIISATFNPAGNETFQKIRVASLQKFPNSNSGLTIIDTLIPNYSLNAGSLTLFKFDVETEFTVSLPNNPAVGDSVDIHRINCDLKLLTDVSALEITNAEIEYLRPTTNYTKLYYLGEPFGWWEVSAHLTVRKFGAIVFEANPEWHGVFYGLATNFGTEAWDRADLRGEVLITASSFIDTRVPGEALDRQAGSNQDTVSNPPVLNTKPGLPVAYNCWHSNSSGTNWWKVDFLARTFMLKQYSIQGRQGSYGLENWILEASNDDTNWIVIDNPTWELDQSPYEYDSPLLSNDISYRYYRFTNGKSGYAIIGEVEFYGELEE